MRFLPALTGALLITVAVFLFMQSLIRAGQQEVVTLPTYSTVEVSRQEREEEPQPEPELETPRQLSQEPAMAALEISPPITGTNPIATSITGRRTSGCSITMRTASISSSGYAFPSKIARWNVTCARSFR